MSEELNTDLRRQLYDVREDRITTNYCALCQQANMRIAELEQELDQRKKNCNKHRKVWLEANRRFTKVKDNEINRLRQENGRLREALEKGCAVCQEENGYPKGYGDEKDKGKMNCHLCYAHKALSATDEPNAALEDDMSTEMLARVTARDV